MASAAVRKLQRRIARYAATVEPELARRLLRAYEVIRTSLNEAEIIAILNSGAGVERAALSITKLADFDSFLISGIGPQLNEAALGAGAQFAVDLPTQIARDGVKNGVSLLNPRVLDSLAKLQTRMFAKVERGVANTIRQVIQRGLEDGIGSKAIARGIRDSLALAPNQELAVHNFERLIREGKLSEVIGRKPRPSDIRIPGRALRDRRFDGTLKKAFAPGGPGLSEKQIERMTAAYRRRMEAFNANTQARSAALDATRKGQRMSWDDAIKKGLIRKDESWKRRHAVGDRRTRPEHAAMDLEEQKIDDEYTNGEITSGDSSHNCRCSDEYFIRKVSTRARPDRNSPLAATPRAVNSTTLLQPPPIPATSAPPVVAPGAQAGAVLLEEEALVAAEAFAVEESIALDLVLPRGQSFPFISDDVLGALLKANPEKIPIDKIVFANNAQISTVRLGRTRQFIRREVTPVRGRIGKGGFLSDAPALFAADDGTFIIMQGETRITAEAIRREAFIQARVFRPPPAPARFEAVRIDGVWKPSARATNPAKLTREGLLAGIPDDEIRAVLSATFPDYGAVKIAVSVYRRELIKKGLLPPKGIVKPPGPKPPPGLKTPKPKPTPTPVAVTAEIEAAELAVTEAEAGLKQFEKLLKRKSDGISAELKLQLQTFGATDGSLVPSQVAREKLIASGHFRRVGIAGRVEMTEKGQALFAELGQNDVRVRKALVARRKTQLAEARGVSVVEEVAVVEDVAAVASPEIEAAQVRLTEAEKALADFDKVLAKSHGGISDDLKQQVQAFANSKGNTVPLPGNPIQTLIKSGHFKRVGGSETMIGRLELTAKGKKLAADLGPRSRLRLEGRVATGKENLAKAQKSAGALDDVVAGVDPLKNAEDMLEKLDAHGNQGRFVDTARLAKLEAQLKRYDKQIAEWKAREKAKLRDFPDEPPSLRGDRGLYIEQLENARDSLLTSIETRKTIIADELAFGPSPLRLQTNQQGSFGFFKKTVKGDKRAKADAAREWTEAHVHKRWLKETKVTVRGSSSSSSHQRGDAIHMTKFANTPVYTHEMGHSIDQFNRELVEAAEEFFKARAKNSDIKNLGFSRQGGREVSRPNEFFNPYVGKTYNKHFGGLDPIDAAKAGVPSEMEASEILSMGLESMMEDPTLFARQDFGHFMFILEIMQGRIPTVFYGAENLGHPILRLRQAPRIVTFP